MRQERDFYETSCREFLESRVYRGRQHRWSAAGLTRTVEHVSGLSAGAGDGVDGAWTVVTARLVAVFRYERYKMRRIDEFNDEQERKLTG